VKCLHTHYAWFLAGGDDPVGRWVDVHLDRVRAFGASGSDGSSPDDSTTDGSDR